MVARGPAGCSPSAASIAQEGAGQLRAALCAEGSSSSKVQPAVIPLLTAVVRLCSSSSNSSNNNTLVIYSITLIIIITMIKKISKDYVRTKVLGVEGARTR